MPMDVMPLHDEAANAAIALGVELTSAECPTRPTICRLTYCTMSVHQRQAPENGATGNNHTQNSIVASVTGIKNIEAETERQSLTRDREIALDLLSGSMKRSRRCSLYWQPKQRRPQASCPTT